MTSGADIAIAAGTIAAAGVAAAGLIVSLVINKLDRGRADTQAEDDRDRADQRAKQDRDTADERAARDRKAALDMAATDRTLSREDAERRHVVDLLLDSLGRQVATFEGMQGTDQARVARQQVTLLLTALPPECASTVRKKFGVPRTAKVPGAIGVKQQYLKIGHLTGRPADYKE